MAHRFKKFNGPDGSIYTYDDWLSVILPTESKGTVPAIGMALELPNLNYEESNLNEFEQALKLANARIANIVNQTPEALQDTDRILFH